MTSGQPPTTATTPEGCFEIEGYLLRGPTGEEETDKEIFYIPQYVHSVAAFEFCGRLFNVSRVFYS